MVLFDAIIGNTDRHLNNWEYILNLDGSIIQAPLFDNGASLLACEQNLPHSIHRLGRDLAKPFEKTHFAQIKLMKKYFPQYTFNIYKQQTWHNIYTEILPILQLINKQQRSDIMLEYLYKRFDKHVTAHS